MVFRCAYVYLGNGTMKRLRPASTHKLVVRRCRLKTIGNRIECLPSLHQTLERLTSRRQRHLCTAFIDLQNHLKTLRNTAAPTLR